MVHALNPQTGEDVNPPAKFTGGGARIAGAVFIDNVVYAAAIETCGSVASGVYAVDLTDNANTVTSWDAKGARIAGASVRLRVPTARSSSRPARRPATPPTPTPSSRSRRAR